MKKNLTRILSGVMAVAISSSYFMPVLTAFGAGAETKPSFAFTQSEKGVDQDAIIEGDVSKFRINSSGKYVLQENAFEILYNDEDIKPEEKQNIFVSDSNTSPKITTKKGLLKNDSKIFVIKGKFNVKGAEAIIATESFKKDEETRVATTKAHLASNEAVTQKSHIVFECTASENDGDVPSFKVSEADGMFNGAFDKSVSVEIKKKNEEYVLSVQPTDKSYIHIHIFPTFSHTLEKSTLTPDGDTKKESYETKNIQKGTKFDITFDIYRTEPIFLTVIKPKKSVDELAEAIKTPTTRDEFVSFADGDYYDFVTRKFTLKGQVKRYRHVHDIRWSSEVVDQSGTKIDKPTEEQNKVIQLPSEEDQSGRDLIVDIKPRVEDTYIKLTAKFILKMGEGKENLYDAEQSFIINVKGTGQLPSTNNIKNFYTVKYDNTEGTTEKDKVAPTPQSSWATGESNIDKEFPIKLDLNNGLHKVRRFQKPPKINGVEQKDDAPHKMGFFFKMGQKNSASVYIKIGSTNPDIIDAEVYDGITSQSKSEPYKYGAEIPNPSIDPYTEGNVVVGFTPKKTGSTTLTVQYFKAGKFGNDVILTQEEKYPIQVIDSSPNGDACLSSLKLVRDDKQQVDLGFDPNKTEYNVTVPHAIKSVNFVPTVRNRLANKNIECERVYKIENGIETHETINDVVSGLPTKEFNFKAGNIDLDYIQVNFTVTAQSEDTVEYKIVVNHAPPSDDAYLKEINIWDKDRDTKFDVSPSFNKDNLDYTVTVPYKVRSLVINPISNHDYAEIIGYRLKKQPDGSYKVDKETKIKDHEGEQGKLELNFDKDEYGLDNPMKVKLKVTPENKNNFYVKEYNINFVRELPNEDSSSKSIKMLDYKSQKEITFSPKFDKELKSYEASVPFETDKIKFKIETSFQDAFKIEVFDNGIKNINDTPPASASTPESKFVAEYKDIEKAKGVIDTSAISVDYIKKDGDYHSFTVTITAQDEEKTTSYNFDVYREPPENEADLKSIIIKGDEAINYDKIDYNFFPDVLEYDITVPYESRTITMTPTAVSEKIAGIEIDADTRVLVIKVESGKETGPIKLQKPEDNKGNPLFTNIKVKCIAQDKVAKREYNYKIRRAAPSSDATLQKLEISGTDPLKPKFMPSETSYKTQLQKDVEEITVTATPTNSASIMWLGDQKLEPGVPSRPIKILETQAELIIKVTAQDGKTTKSYVVDLTNLNPVKQSDNADLDSLTIEYGDMRPRFNPSITNYNVAVSSETDSVRIIPRASDRYAKIEVLKGSKAIGDENGYFYDAIDFGANKYTVKVTSPSEKKVKTYSLTINREVEDKEFSYKPVTPEQINWETEDDIIVVSIVEYPVLTSEVFIKMRDEFPEKTLVLQGNDYSLQFKGKELFKNIPHRVSYDFKLMFETPEEEEIDELLYDIGNNRNLDKIYMYFRYHGNLPGPCVFNISIGNRYGGKKLYMNYFNDERNRIDYYGFVRTNQKGNFSVRLDHFSTYILSNRKVEGAEDRSGYQAGSYNSKVSGTPIVIPSTNKVHPNTSAER